MGYWLLRNCPDDHWIRGEPIYKQMVNMFLGRIRETEDSFDASFNHHFRTYADAVKRVLRGILEEDSIYTIKIDETYLCAIYWIPYDIAHGYDGEKCLRIDSKGTIGRTGDELPFTDDDSYRTPFDDLIGSIPSSSEPYYYEFPPSTSFWEPITIEPQGSRDDQASLTVEILPALQRLMDEKPEFDSFRRDEIPSGGEQWDANPGRHSTITMIGDTILKQGAGHPFSSFLASKIGVSPELIAWGYETGSYWIQTKIHGVDLGRYVLDTVTSGLEDTDELSMDQLSAYKEKFYACKALIQPQLDEIARHMWETYMIYQRDTKLDNFVIEDGVVKMIDCEGLKPEPDLDYDAQIQRAHENGWWSDHQGYSFRAGNSITRVKVRKGPDTDIVIVDILALKPETYRQVSIRF